MPTYDNYAYERVRNAYDKTYDKIMRTTKSRNVRQYSYACRTRTQEARTTTVRIGPKNVVRVYNCRTSVMCFVRLSYACRTTPTIPYDMRTDSVQNTYSRRTKCVRHEKSSFHQLINRAAANCCLPGGKLNKYKSLYLLNTYSNQNGEFSLGHDNVSHQRSFLPIFLSYACRTHVVRKV